MKIKKNGDVWHFWCTGCKCAHGINSTWQFNGDLEKPTIMPSILATGGGQTCHSWVKDGKINFLGDSTHALKGMEVEIPDWPFKDEE